MSIANPNPAQVISGASECMRRLMDAGLSYDDMQIPINDPERRSRIVQFWKSSKSWVRVAKRVPNEVMRC